MSRDQIKYDEVSQALSGARLGTYLRYSKNDVAGAFLLHHVNAQLAASFWEPLELFEVVLRNRLADCLAQTIFYKGIMPSEKILDLPVDCNFLTGSVNL